VNTRAPVGDREAVLTVATAHPAFAGHFPGSPVLPGAVLLDEALFGIERGSGIDITRWRIASVKFLGRVLPGDELVLRYSAPAAGVIRFSIGSVRGPVAAGSLTDAG
jgi:3-hydroxyacyl-[acyl-carrier-protein] dehydratase